MSATLIPHDPALPQLAIALDGERMAEHFAGHLLAQEPANKHLTLTHCAIEHVRYKPGRNCLVSYKLTIEDANTQSRREQVVCGRIYPHQGGESHYRKAQRKTLVPSDIGPSLLHIEPLEMVAWLYPNERKLEGLPALANSEHLRTHILPELVARYWGEDWLLAEAESNVVHYVPEHTFSVKVDLTLKRRLTQDVEHATVFGKTYYNGQGYTTYRNMRRLWVANQTHASALNVPKPLLYQPEFHLLWQEGVEGNTLLEHQRNNGQAAGLYSRAGAAVAGLHRTALGCREAVTVADVAARLQSLPRLVGEHVAGTHAALQPVIERLLKHIPDSRSLRMATLHGDLHAQNILIGDDVFLIDLDNLTTGPALRDIGSFIAEMLYRALLAGEPPPATYGLISRFVNGYSDNISWRIKSTDLAWFTAAALLSERVHRCVSRAKAGRAELISDLITLADRVCRGECLPC